MFLYIKVAIHFLFFTHYITISTLLLFHFPLAWSQVCDPINNGKIIVSAQLPTFGYKPVPANALASQSKNKSHKSM